MTTDDERPRVVIVGAGFAGLACAKALGNRPLRVTIIDRQNYHLFVPLLYQVATAALSPADIAEPIRKILRRYHNIDVILGEVSGIDAGRRRVHLTEGGDIGFDRLIVATGSAYNYFGHDEWAAHAPGLKTIGNARHIRARLLTGFERAEISDDPHTQRALMTSIIIGGGPTGVEMAGATAELARYALARDFRRIDPRTARILLIEAGPRLLASFPEDLATYARRRLEQLGVEVITGRAVQQVRPDGVVVDGCFTPANCIVWAAGITASPAAHWLGAKADHAGRIEVNPDLSVPGFEGVYALGDTARARDNHDQPLPGLAQVAKQQGAHLGHQLSRQLARGTPVAPFAFRNRGNTAIIGRSAAIFDFGRWRMKGWFAWLLWAIIHVYLLMSFEKRVLVAIQWLWRWATYQRGARLITYDEPSAPLAEAEHHPDASVHWSKSFGRQ